MRHVGRSRLDPGKVLLYRMRDDVHVQLPPDRFSVSLDILGHDAAQPWLDQYRFDIRGNTIAQVPTSTPAEALVRFGPDPHGLLDRAAGAGARPMPGICWSGSIRFGPYCGNRAAADG